MGSLLWGLLLGCYAPLSNAVFEEDQAYLAGFPERPSFGPAERFLTGQPPGLAGQVRDAAEDLRWRTTPALEAGALFREATPDRRGPSSRTWEPQGLTTAGVAWWVRAEAVLESDDAVAWTIEAASRSDGDFIFVGEGWWDPADGAGSTSWDLAATASLLEVEGVSGVLEVAWEEDDAGVISSSLTHLEGGQVLLGDPVWEVWDDPSGAFDGLAFVDRFQVTEDGASHTGWALAVESDTAGRASGVVLDDSGAELSFQQCWDAEGEASWQGGDTGITAFGDEADCGIPAL